MKERFTGTSVLVYSKPTVRI